VSGRAGGGTVSTPGGNERLATGQAVRRELLGDDYVDETSATAWAFAQPFTDLMTEFAWGTIWTRPGLSRRDRSLLNIGILAAGNLEEDLITHFALAVRNGLTLSEIQEAIMQIGVYCGGPVGIFALRCARKAFDHLGIDADTEIETGGGLSPNGSRG
jgi:4-carboxymuconolactone decarboxylase